ncbi:MarR family winged helix-turn-helix transcriptional regulator [Mesorhizobium sp. VK23B]|uniref:MarR family winged helix-turn-helix transcriptional regulator n=1 Tax=Mesorhizobium dulcispinae TaxID=3072316 RepID=A0ABU4XA44_9HYPH|nr:MULTISPECIES: MarR family winged helix-turn-helix transcriptional regulator [unclassified Mesorhizobium]MDX8464635.1 MarR family winged helix-turn-helix transcriptional regulator [Mesorhizobium sp. VK23B]MDX8471021.1 MarR family winged helix-turn-helix transcriptional regulator [Mesorhizobium sp. VK23A]
MLNLSIREPEVDVLVGLLTASKPELLDGGEDRTLRTLLHDYFAFARNLEEARAKFASYIGLSPTQYMILILLAHSPQDEPLGINQIADRLHLSGAFVTIEVNKLVAEDLVHKSGHPTDGRRVQLVVTEEGLNRLKRLAAFQRPVNDALFGMLSHDEFGQLSRLLAKLAANGEKAVKLAGYIEATR